MRIIGIALAKTAGVLLMIAAFWVWISYDYPNVNAFMPGAIFAPGMVGQVFNWIVVCVLAAAGLSLFTLGGKKIKTGRPEV